MSAPLWIGGAAGWLLHSLLPGLLLASAKASVAVLLVLAVRAAAGRRLAPRWRTALWLLVAVRLVLPVAPASPWSLFSLASRAGLDDRGGSAELLPGLGPASERPTAGAASGAPGSWPAIGRGLPAALDVAWLAGIALLALRRRSSGRRLAGLLLRVRPIDDPETLAILAGCRAALGLRREVALAESDEVAGPCLCPAGGRRRPLILLPAGTVSTLGAARLRHVLLHELAHLGHRDLGTRRVADALVALHWFNPLVHLAARALCADQELAADARALAELPATERPGYGRTLLDLLPGATADAPAAAFVETRRQLHRRIAMIASFTPRHRLAALAAAGLLALLAGFVLTDGASLAAGPPEPAAATAAPAVPGSADETPTVDPQAQAMRDVRDLGVAMYSWMDHHTGEPTPSARSAEETRTSFDWSRCPAISAAELRELLVPDYAERLPELDPWGTPYQLCLDRATITAPELDHREYLVGVRTAGSDRVFESSSYAGGPHLPSQGDRDVVWIDGFFVTWPENPQSPE